VEQSQRIICASRDRASDYSVSKLQRKNLFKKSEFNAAIGQNRLNEKPAKVFGSSVAQRNP
jgi:hypothetical protein